MYFLTNSAKYCMIAVFFIIIIVMVVVSIYKIRQLRKEYIKRIEKGLIDEDLARKYDTAEDCENGQLNFVSQDPDLYRSQIDESRISEKELTYLKYDPENLWNEYEDKSKKDRNSDEEEWSSMSSPPTLKFLFYYQMTKGIFRVHLQDAESLDAFKSNAEKQNLKSRVRLFVLTTSRKQLKQKTSIYEECNDVVFDEAFAFPLKEKELEGATLNLSAWSIDEFHKEELIGSININISEYDLEEKNQLEEVLVQPKHEIEYDRGHLLLSLCYVASIEKLMVIIMKAKELSQNNCAFELLADRVACSVKVSLICGGKTTKSFETIKKFGTTSPVFNEMVEFIVTPEQMSSVDLNFAVLRQDTSKEGVDCIGRLLLGTHAAADDKSHWDRMLSATGSSGAEWHKLEP